MLHSLSNLFNIICLQIILIFKISSMSQDSRNSDDDVTSSSTPMTAPKSTISKSEDTEYWNQNWYHLNKDEYVYLLAPITIGFGSSFICPIGNNAGVDVPARPPSYVFIIVWTLIYAMLGIVWVWIRRIINNIENEKERECEEFKLNIIMLANILCLLTWVCFYKCSNIQCGTSDLRPGGCSNNKYIYVLAINIIVMLITLGFIFKFDKCAGVFIFFIYWTVIIRF